jgi:hypothetical protein
MEAAWHFPQVFDLPRPGDTKTNSGKRTTYLLPDWPPIAQGPSGSSVNFPVFVERGLASASGLK